MLPAEVEIHTATVRVQSDSTRLGERTKMKRTEKSTRTSTESTLVATRTGTVQYEYRTTRYEHGAVRLLVR